MPRKYTRRSRKTPWGTKRFRPFSGTTRKLAKSAYAMAKRAMPELHLLDNFLDLDTLANHSTTIASADDSEYLVDTTGNVKESHLYRLAKIAEGDGPDNRTGQTVTMKAIYMKIQTILGGGASGANFRALLIQDLEPNATVPATNTVLDIQAGNNVPHVTAFRNINSGNRKRYRILRDTTVQLKADANKQMIKWNVNLPRKRTAYDSNNRGKSGVDYFVLFISDSAAGNITINPSARIRFYP